MQLNIHNVKSVEFTRRAFNGDNKFHTLDFIIRDEKGNKFEVTLFSADKIKIEGR